MEIKVGELYWDRSLNNSVVVESIGPECVMVTRLRPKKSRNDWSYYFNIRWEKEELDNLILLVEDVEEEREECQILRS